MQHLERKNEEKRQRERGKELTNERKKENKVNEKNEKRPFSSNGHLKPQKYLLSIFFAKSTSQHQVKVIVFGYREIKRERERKDERKKY